MKRVILAAVLAVTALLPQGTSAATVRITLPADVIQQLSVWVTEVGGLNTDLGSATFLTTPANLIPRSDLGGLTLVTYETAQRDLYNFLVANNGKAFNTTSILPDWKTALNVVADSYSGAPDLLYTINGTTTTILRSKMQTNLNLVRTTFGLSVVLLQQPSTSVTLSTLGEHHTQWGLPVATCSTTNWTEGAGTDAVDWSVDLNEGFGAGRGTGSGPDDATRYWQSPSSPAVENIRVTLGQVYPVPIPSAAANSSHFFFKIRYEKSASAGQQLDISAILVFTSCGVDQWGGNPTFANIVNSWTTSNPDYSDIGKNQNNLSAVALGVQCNKVGGGAGRRCFLSTVEVDVDDVSGASS